MDIFKGVKATFTSINYLIQNLTMERFIITILCFIALTACSNTDNESKEDILSGVWNVQNISGGFVGMDQDFEEETITWTFNADNSTLTVVNNNVLVDVIYDGLDTGSYPYTIIEVDNERFLEIDGQEFGGILFTNGQLLLDQNKISTGSGADGFILLFKLEID
ncbi:hypothetical protein DKG77_11300 [Flagellimonas aquimarina]|uniref:Lipocalin-like domain-containing protein n=2 Tax=Flagellimonas aquimarina TaxID=2201895 RepID=A0A316LFF8_9FLAO|nr:hypothetical protein DKG77_11300 [Allomuricauda koreensis]